jgi:Bacteriophage tail sheath protein
MATMESRRPGVFIERVDATRVPPVVLRTDIAAFVGIAERGPIDIPVPIESMRQFTAHFGGFIGGGYLAYMVSGFFANGGARCWVVRVAAREFTGDVIPLSGARAARVEIPDLLGRPALRISASSAGTWGNALQIAWSPFGATTAVTLPATSTPQFVAVPSTAGFAQDELVRIDGLGLAGTYRVIAAVDQLLGRIYWVHPDPHVVRATDEPLAAPNPTAPLRIVRVAYGLVVRELGDVVAQYADLQLIPAHPRYIGRVLARPFYWAQALVGSALAANPATGEQPDDTAFADLPRAPEPVVATWLQGDLIPTPLAVSPLVPLVLADGADGLVDLAPSDFIGEAWDAQDDDFERARKARGLQALAKIDEIALVAVPDILIRPEEPPQYLPPRTTPGNPCVTCPPPPRPRQIHQPRPQAELPPVFTADQIAQVQATLIATCEAAGDRFAVLGLPFDLATAIELSGAEAVAWRMQFDSRVAALYAPWIAVADPIGWLPTRLVPPCGHVLGAIAATDLTIGVQRAPANVALSELLDLARPVDDSLHARWNDAGVNALRIAYGRDPQLEGARTLAYDPQWRYVNVVRLTLAIKKAADIALRWSVFEPNDEILRANVRATLLAILRLFFIRGAFAGDTEDTSFFVRCDEALNPPEARAAGQLLALVGFAPAAPCEFILLRVGTQLNAPSVSLFALPSEATS